ncbi:hypothetical protein ACFWA9_38910, partial [Kitasatospora sp. NPDC059973]
PGSHRRQQRAAKSFAAAMVDATTWQSSGDTCPCPTHTRVPPGRAVPDAVAGRRTRGPRPLPDPAEGHRP